MIARGYIAAVSALILLAGNVAVFLLVTINTSIGPAAKGDVTGLVAPLTVAALVSAGIFVKKNAHLRLGETKEANWLFVLFAIGIPLLFLTFLIFEVLKLDGAKSVDEFKTRLAYMQAFFGGVFVFATEALFSES